ncbi:hypothetical protein [Hydrogenophaga sp. OTU3427]|uniref:hypothetical protein n=1 Tax=Hydrogenophaga sp. OTU3427 TaxID=3043856 RepID=UPI00313ADBBE
MNVATLLLVAILGLAAFGAFQLTKIVRQELATRKALRLQEERDEREFWEYEAKHKSIRLKFDPANEWNEATSVPEAFLREVRDLNLHYKPMLQRRNGWTESDFRDTST